MSKHVHKAEKKLSFSKIEVCKCGQFRYAKDDKFDNSQWKLHYFRYYGGRRPCPFQIWLKQNNEARS